MPVWLECSQRTSPWHIIDGRTRHRQAALQQGCVKFESPTLNKEKRNEQTAHAVSSRAGAHNIQIHESKTTHCLYKVRGGVPYVSLLPIFGNFFDFQGQESHFPQKQGLDAPLV